MPKQIIRVTSHYLDHYEACPLYFNYRVNEKMVEPTAPSKIALGTAIHLVLAEYYREIKDNKSTEEAIESASEKFLSQALTINGFEVSDIETVIKALNEYVSHYRDRDDFNILAVEETLSDVIYEDDNLIILYSGTIDLLTERSGLVVPYDHKSESARFNVPSLSNQLIGYCYLTRSPRITRNAIGLQKKKPVHEKMYRQMFSYSQATINWWVDNTVKQTMRILESYRIGEWTANLSSCGNMFRSACPYQQVCISPVEDREEELNRGFVRAKLYDEAFRSS